jgi:hypothetical protein
MLCIYFRESIQKQFSETAPGKLPVLDQAQQQQFSHYSVEMLKTHIGSRSLVLFDEKVIS